MVMSNREVGQSKVAGMWHHRVVSYREFMWSKKLTTQLYNMKFHRGGNK